MTTQKNTGLVIDHQRARVVLDALVQRKRDWRYPFNKPLDVLPPEAYELFDFGGKEHAMFLFNLCYYMRGGIQSDEAAGRFVKIYQKHPHLFTAHYFRARSTGRLEEISDEVYEALWKNELNYTARGTSRAWAYNASKIHHHWGGNPVNLFEKVSSYDGACRIITNKGGWWKRLEQPNHFYGFQEKMVSMIMYFLAQAKMIDIERFPPPIDFHFFRMLLSTEIIRVEAGVEQVGRDYLAMGLREVSRVAREAMLAYMRYSSVSSLELSDVVWNYSRDMCSKNPGNRSSQDGPRRGRNTKITPKEFSWSSAATLGAYENSCGLCPVSEYCRYNVPSKEYYVNGRLSIRSERARPPAHLRQMRIPFVDQDPVVERTKRWASKKPEAKPSKGETSVPRSVTLFD